MYIHMAAAEDGVRDVSAIAETPGGCQTLYTAGWAIVTPSQGSLSLSIIIHKRDTGSSAPLRHRVVRKAHATLFLGYPSPSAVSPWRPRAQL